MIQYLLTGIQLILTAGIIYSGVGFFYHYLADRLEEMMPSAPPRASRTIAAVDTPRPPEHTVEAIPKYRIISERNLFKTGTVSEPTTADVSTLELENMDQTRLKLKLWGTVSGEGKIAYAVIDEGDREGQNLFREGDTLKGAVLKRILRERVVLTVNGKDEILEMDQELSGAVPHRPGGRMPPPSREDDDEDGEEDTETFQMARSTIDESLEDINGLMKQVKIRPHFRNGQPDGLMLSRISSSSIFRKMGLRNGDIVVGVDGNEIESVEDAMKFYENLVNASSVELQIRRRGKLKTILYEIE